MKQVARVALCHQHHLRQSLSRAKTIPGSSTPCASCRSSGQAPTARWQSTRQIQSFGTKRHFSQTTTSEESTPETKDEVPPETSEGEDVCAEGSATTEELQARQIDELTSQLEERTAKNKEMEDRLIRTFADMENVRRIARTDVETKEKFAVQKFAKSLLDVADNLARAIDSVDPPNDQTDPQLKSLLEGVQMTDTQLAKIFKEFGISQFGAEGDPFDPQKHDALFAVDDSSKEPNTIATVIKTGYMLHERVIRPAQVGAVKGPA